MIFELHNYRATANIGAPDRHQVASFFANGAKTEFSANELILATVCAIGIFQIRQGRAPSGISAQTLQGATPQLIATLISMNKTFLCK